MYVHTTYTSSLSVQAQYSTSCLIISSSYYNSLVTWTAVWLSAAIFKPLIFPVSRFALSNVRNIRIVMVLYDFCLWPAYFGYMIVYIRKFVIHLQIANGCAPWKISNGAENFVLQSLQFEYMVVCRKPPGGANISHGTPYECFVEGQFNVSA
jgi:hypothetical protein